MSNIKSKLDVITGITSIVFGAFTISALITRFSDPVPTLILCAIFFFVFLGLYFLLQSKSQEQSGVKEKNKKKKKKERLAERKAQKFRRIYAVLMFVLALVSAFGYYIYLQNSKDCTFDSDKIGIGISRFSEEEESFSRRVYLELLKRDLKRDLYDIKHLEQSYLTELTSSEFSNVADTLCFERGLLITGWQDLDADLFYAEIIPHNFFTDKDQLDRPSVLRVSPPEMKDFKADFQSKNIVDFVEGLLAYQKKDFQKAKTRFQAVIDKTADNNSSLASYSHTFLGNMLFKRNKHENARAEFKLAILSDSTNQAAQGNDIKNDIEMGDLVLANDKLRAKSNLGIKMVRDLQQTIITKSKSMGVDIDDLTDRDSSKYYEEMLRTRLLLDQKETENQYLSMRTAFAQAQVDNLRARNGVFTQVIDSLELEVLEWQRKYEQKSEERVQSTEAYQILDSVAMSLKFEIVKLVENSVRKNSKVTVDLKRKYSRSAPQNGLVLDEDNSYAISRNRIKQMYLNIDTDIPEFLQLPKYYFNLRNLEDAAQSHVVGSDSDLIPIRLREGSAKVPIDYSYEEYRGLFELTIYYEADMKVVEFHKITFRIQ